MTRVSLIALMLLMSGSSWAGWQDTRWGMTLDEVIAAGKGKIKPYKDDTQNKDPSDKYSLLAKQEYNTTSGDFDVNFSFDNGKLSTVQLIPKFIDDAPYLLRSLKETYGQPVVSEGKSGNSANCKDYITSWRDEKSSNLVRYDYTICKDVYIIAYITYQPLPEPGKSGL